MASRERTGLRERVDAVPYWFHSIDLGGGVVTPGHKPEAVLRAEFDALGLPDLRGRSVLDIGGWDGFFAFEAERRGAARVAVLDHFMWSMDTSMWGAGEAEQKAYWRERLGEGVRVPPYEETEFWRPDTMPGKAGFDIAREALGSGVEDFPVDFMDCDLDAIGRWDVVLYLGVLYHMPDPLGALRRVAAVTRELAVVETEAVVVPGYEHEALWRFFAFDELDGDLTNWWAPNLSALGGMLLAAGFSQARAVVGPSPRLLKRKGGPHHYRAVVQAAT
jgi:tRNA (mo5U34)-methyltransferase